MNNSIARSFDDIKLFKQAMSKFATGVTVASTCYDNKLFGFTASSFVSVSLNPMLVSVCINNNSASFEAFSKSNFLGFSILSKENQDLSDHFASRIYDKFAGIDYYLTKDHNIPLLNNILVSLECSKFKQITAGDHDIIIAKILHININQKIDSLDPLIYFNKNYL